MAGTPYVLCGQINNYKKLFDTVWISPQRAVSLNDGEACYILVEKLQESGNFLQRTAELHKGANIHGTANYEYLYRSRIDTPFQQQGFQQHITRGAFRTDLMGKYPVNVNLAYKVSNSPYIRNTVDVNVGFDPYAYRRRVEERLLAKVRGRLEEKYNVPGLEGQYRQAVADASYWAGLVSTPDFSMMQEKARDAIVSRITEKLQESDSLVNGDSINSSISNYINGGPKAVLAEGIKKNSSVPAGRVDSILSQYGSEMDDIRELSNKPTEIAGEVKGLYGKLQSAKKMATDSLGAYRARLLAAKDGKGLGVLLQDAGLSKDSVSKMQRLLMTVKAFNIGRSAVEYSPLTVRNISVTGISVAVSPGPYLAVAAGFVDYRFRDFIFKNSKAPRQAAVMARLGLSGSAGKGFFITGFTGRREIVNSSNNTRPRYSPVSGYSLQYIWQAARFGTVSAELAKSNGPAYRQGAAGNGKEAAGMFDFGLRGNEAYSLSYNGQVPATRTKLKASYQRLGSDFQSLSMYTYNASQSSWSVMADQPLFGNMLVLRAGMRKNDFTYPYLTNLSSNAVFKTAQLTFKKKGLPTVVAGYYPATQLVMMPDKDAAEFIYHTFSLSGSHQYKVLGLSNSSMLLYSRFYNKSSDTSFMYFNASYWGYQHYVWLSPFTIQAGYTATIQQRNPVRSIEGSLSWAHRAGITLGGGLKWNTMGPQGNLWGGNARASVPVRKVGNIQLCYELGSLPAWQERKLVPVSTGRLIYTKTF